MYSSPSKDGPTQRKTMKATRLLTFALAFLATAGLARVPAQAQINPPGLVSLWAAEGDASDSAGGNHGLLRGGVSFAQGMVGQAFAFDGATAYVEVPDNPSLDLQSNLTMMAWIYLEQLPSQAGHVMHLLGKSQAGNDCDLQLETDDRAHFYMGAGVAIVSSTVFKTGIWYQVVATYSAASRMQLFVNGVREASAAIGVVRAPNTNPWTLAWNIVFPGRFFSGRMDQVRVLDAVLSDDAIEALYTAESGILRARIYTAAEVCWRSVANVTYQVQWAPSASSTLWTNLGAPLQGTGDTLCVLDSTRAADKKFYRVKIIP
jgi:hypothetical protein